MTVVDFPSAAPSVCFICESADPGATFWDTARGYSPISSYLAGRKWLCSSCVADAADHLGILDSSKAPLQNRIDLLTVELTEKDEKLALLTAVEGAITKIADQRATRELKDRTATAAKKHKPEPRKAT